MAIAIIVGRNDQEIKEYDWFIKSWRNELLDLDSTLDIRVLPDLGDAKEIDAVFVWQPPLGIFKKFPQLKLIVSLAAGVDHVINDPDLPKHIPLVRVMDPYMANDIVQYVQVCVLNYVKRMPIWAEKQKEKVWFKKPPFNYSDKTIGIMGLGYLGEKAARALIHVGLNVIGWRYSNIKIPDIKTYSGNAEFSEFLSQSDILVCMLPLTTSTKNILNEKTFSQLPKGAYLINLGRGEHLVEEDLLKALSSDQLVGACLDVFRMEPLPQDHPFWTHPKIVVTPHIASVTNPKTAVKQVYENYQNMKMGKKLSHAVNLEKGY